MKKVKLTLPYYSGLTDKNGNKICKGDKVVWSNFGTRRIKYDRERCCFRMCPPDAPLTKELSKYLEII